MRQPKKDAKIEVRLTTEEKQIIKNYFDKNSSDIAYGTKYGLNSPSQLEISKPFAIFVYEQQ